MHRTNFASFCFILILIEGNVAGRTGSPPVLNPIPAIVGGTDAALGEFPYQGLLYITKIYTTYICGCSLLSSKWAVTAAHCTDGATADNIKVFFGKVVRPSTYTPSEYSVYKIYQHPSYKGKETADYHHDIALLHLRDEVGINEYVSPIALPLSGEILQDGTSCNITGWGHLSSYSTYLPQVLQKARVSIVSNAFCRELLSYEEVSRIFNEQICAGYLLGGIGGCQGDSGGPLACRSSSGTPVLQGIVSLNVPCANRDKPDIFTRVSSYVNWIEKTMGNIRIFNNVNSLKKNETIGNRLIVTQQTTLKIHGVQVTLKGNEKISERIVQKTIAAEQSTLKNHGLQVTLKGDAKKENDAATISVTKTKYFVLAIFVLAAFYVL